ncbi:MAG: diguanylate cyclase [Candidatus Cloacimonadales bacterium]
MNIELEKFIKLERSLQADLPLEESLSRIIKNIDQQITYQSLGIFLKVPRTELYRLKIGRNISHQFSKDTIFTKSDPLMEQLADLQKIEVDEFGFYKFEHDFKHMIILPLFYDKTIFGFIFVDSQKFFDSDQIKILEFYCSFISFILKIHILEDDIINHQGIYEANQIYDFKAFMHKANNSFAIMKRYNRDFSIIVFVLENYKQLVRTIGETKMENILRDIGNCIKSNLRNTDIIANIHQKSFVIALPETSTPKAALTIKRIEKNLQPILEANKILRGWGISESNEELPTMSDLLKEAQGKALEAVRKEKTILY